jgi:hypothetical protein
LAAALNTVYPVRVDCGFVVYPTEIKGSVPV